MAATGGKSTVRMPGIVLSSLMFQHLNSESDVEGLILGESISEEQVTINDTQADQIQIEEIYNIKQHIACPKLQGFYTSTGEIDVAALKKLLGDSKQVNVIGWYKQRRNTSQQITLRERAILKNLKTTLSNPHLIFLLLTSNYFTTSGSTHKTEYGAYTLSCSQVTNVPVLVNNLGLLEPVSYCKAPALCSAEGYKLTIQKHRSKFFSTNGSLNDVEDINSMNESLQSELYSMCRDVVKSEKQLEALQLEVSALRRKVEDRKQDQLHKEPCKPPPEQKRNILLHEAVKALFGNSVMFQSQTLTTAAFPVLDFCCGIQSEDNDTGAGQSDDDEWIHRKSTSRKRSIEMSLGNELKRKKI